ncbi:uncharacterized protein A1O5_10635 [Cladophialophora psammophila CBS 110553]|uniref:Uncharacterized protein n=1 Tax=Cladophialophora psammophila CBS 110553 TaxID=1182543 RepID=W9WN13_9EURO|nr:uncharacterized protein A1O5_10635 [Cladophialophora psammophila CBS 110553]EXJ66021.1 hypothetical protein A1O5_10635 [Cladophialophora psammophila CBS 110553]
MSSKLSQIDKVSKDLNRNKTVPFVYLRTLEDRLVLLCTFFGRQPRSAERRPKKEVNAVYCCKKAQKVYFEVLETYPHVFLPFILAISPRSCLSFDLSQLGHYNSPPDGFHWSNNVKETFASIGQKREISEGTYYKKVIEVLFLSWPSTFTQIFKERLTGADCCPKPVSTAEADKHLAYHAAELAAIVAIFGNRIYGGVEISSVRLSEKARSRTLQTTESVRTKFPLRDLTDGIIYLDIGCAAEYSSVLFPDEGDVTGVPISRTRECTSYTAKGETSNPTYG